jgi:hypothetical protein
MISGPRTCSWKPPLCSDGLSVFLVPTFHISSSASVDLYRWCRRQVQDSPAWVRPGTLSLSTPVPYLLTLYPLPEASLGKLHSFMPGLAFQETYLPSCLFLFTRSFLGEGLSPSFCFGLVGRSTDEERGGGLHSLRGLPGDFEP